MIRFTFMSPLGVWNGDLIAGGSFTTAGGQTVNHIARWDAPGNAWHPFTFGGQIGMNNTVYALTVWNDDLIVGGTFTTAGGQTVNRIARWDAPGNAWHPFTSGGPIGVNGTARSVMLWNDDLIVGGAFTTAGGQMADRIARWDALGKAWHPFTFGGEIGVNSTVLALTVWNGDLIAGGAFTTAGGQTVNRIARWGCPEEAPCPGDLTGNGSVGVPDLLALLACWGPVVPGSGCGAADLTGSGNVGVPDLLALLAAWGPCPQ